MTVQTLLVCESLTADHRNMEVFLENMEQLLSNFEKTTTSSQEFPALKNCLNDLLSRMEAEINLHFACEEQCLFPAVAPYHSMVLMEAEHEDLMCLWNQLKEANAGLEMEAAVSVGRQFIEEMRNHIAREDAGIFPTCERSLSEVEKTRVYSQITRLREKALQEPIPPIQRTEADYNVITMDLNTVYPRPVMIQLLLEQGNTQFKQLTLQKGESLNAHWSPKQITLICMKGSATFEVKEKTVLLQPGACILMDPKLLHVIHAHAETQLLLIMQK